MDITKTGFEIKGLNTEMEAKYEGVGQEINQFGQAKTQTVTDRNSADWALMKLGELESQDKNDGALAAAKIREWEDWLADQEAKRAKFRDYLEHELMAFGANERAKDPKFKFSTPNGKITFRKSKAAPQWEDDAAVLDFIKSNWSLEEAEKVISVKESFNKSEVKKYLKVVGDKVVDDDGQIVPGVGVKPASETISIKPTTEANNA